MKGIINGRFHGTFWTKDGSGCPLILVHGLGMNSQMWQWQKENLAKHFSVICYDLLGHGESGRPNIPCKLSEFSDQLLTLLKGLKIDNCALVGFSLGGLIVQDFTLKYPKKVKALAILNTAHGRTNLERKAILLRAQQAHEYGPESTVEAALDRWFSKDFKFKNPRIIEKIRSWILLNDEYIYPKIYRLLAQSDKELKYSISSIKCPTMVMTGEEDHANSPEMAKRMATLIPNSRLQIIPGLRHMGLVENPKAYNFNLLSFFQEVLK